MKTFDEMGVALGGFLPKPTTTQNKDGSFNHKWVVIPTPALNSPDLFRRIRRDRASISRLKIILAAAYLIVNRLEPDFRKSRKKALTERWSSQ